MAKLGLPTVQDNLPILIFTNLSLISEAGFFML